MSEQTKTMSYPRCRECGQGAEICGPLIRRLIGHVCEDCLEQYQIESQKSAEQLREESEDAGRDG